MVPQLRSIAANSRNPLRMSLKVPDCWRGILNTEVVLWLDNEGLVTMRDSQLVVDVVLNPLIKQHA
ncbi:hypothetical protein M404DRAFT_1009232 [Pisolithus tinctorius Marx 270]|uniref:Uncharacterized protein n=1 Tax=Pisolithus tinctorius Marx 270 TaxID=870435 RepID=A0A0C3J5P0_PISTI|nr:hypothetical protein M404DRAFT_1009232 [Pisolithus tinctorius Marx 270]